MNEKQTKKHKELINKVLKMKDIFYVIGGVIIYLTDGFVAYKTNIYLTDINEVLSIENRRNNSRGLYEQLEKYFSIGRGNLSLSIYPTFNKNKNKNFFVHIENGKIIKELKNELADNGPLINMRLLKFFRKDERLILGNSGNDKPLLVKTEYIEMLVMPIIYTASEELKLKESLGDICEVA